MALETYQKRLQVAHDDASDSVFIRLTEGHPDEVVTVEAGMSAKVTQTMLSKLGIVRFHMEQGRIVGIEVPTGNKFPQRFLSDDDDPDFRKVTR